MDFHGHWCPGLAIGLRAGEYVINNLGRADDEEVVALVETDMCAVDAIQVLTNCTFGKGNLKFRDHGKLAFTFFRRKDGKGVRLVFDADRLGSPDSEFAELNRQWLKGRDIARGQTTAHGHARGTQPGHHAAPPWMSCSTVKEPAVPMPHSGPHSHQPQVRGLRRGGDGVAHPPPGGAHPVHRLLRRVRARERRRRHASPTWIDKTPRPSGGAEGIEQCPNKHPTAARPTFHHGFFYLIGCGPGGPRTATLQALETIQAMDVILAPARQARLFKPITSEPPRWPLIPGKGFGTIRASISPP